MAKPEGSHGWVLVIPGSSLDRTEVIGPFNERGNADSMAVSLHLTTWAVVPIMTQAEVNGETDANVTALTCEECGALPGQACAVTCLADLA